MRGAETHLQSPRLRGRRPPRPQPVGGLTIRQRRRRRALRLAGVDVLMLVLAVIASQLGAARADAPAEPLGWAAVYLVLTVALVAARGGYRVRIDVSPLEYVREILSATGVAATLVISARVLFGPSPELAAESVRLWGFSAVYLLAARWGLAIANHRPDRSGTPTLIVGAGSVGRTVARRLLERREIGLRPVGFLDKEPRRAEQRHDVDLPVVGASWDLERVAHEQGVEHVIVTFSTAPHAVLLNLVRRCRALGIEVSLVPRLFEEVSSRMSVEHLGGIALLRVEQADPRGWQFEIKYAVDRVVGVMAVVVLSPVLLIVAALVRLTSPGPVFFRQARIGRDGREFHIYKFRTMWTAPAGRENDAAWVAQQLGGAPDDTAGDPAVAGEDRRTPIGTFLRRWSLDELPQLLNIARGDMSLIGPRPERTGIARSFEEHIYRYGDRHRVKSGLTGWAQVQGLRGETSLADRVEWDNWYVENWTPWLDVKIILLTIPAVLRGSAER